VARAQIKSAEASLARARQNLAYATITAPVSGIVVERAVDVGQTVAASLAAPRLFTIANYLSEMQILAPVDESDIGQIKEGRRPLHRQDLPRRTFTGVVKQVRLQSTIDQNIVNYTVVISVPTRRHVAARHDRHRRVRGCSAERPRWQRRACFRPSRRSSPGAAHAKQLEERPRRGRRRCGRGPAAGAPRRRKAGRGRRRQARRLRRQRNRARAARAIVPLLPRRSGKLAMMPVRPGITDGQYTEVRGPFLEEGMQVIAGMSQAAATPSTNPFQGTQTSGPRRPPGIF
jgi:HlyD family secretion protein